MNFPTGSISTGTLRDADLAPTFLDLLDTLTPESATQDRLALDRLRAEVDVIVGTDGAENFDGETIAEITDRINERLPAPYYFGAHPGDGADFGVWLDEDYDPSPLY